MSDSDSESTAWIVPPSHYARQREAAFTLPDRPVSVYVPMRDGCRLALDYYLPRAAGGEHADGRFPVIVLFTPYYRRFALADASLGTEPTPNAGKYRDYFVPRGYALVVVDVRGTGASFGTPSVTAAAAAATGAAVLMLLTAAVTFFFVGTASATGAAMACLATLRIFLVKLPQPFRPLRSPPCSTVICPAPYVRPTLHHGPPATAPYIPD